MKKKKITVVNDFIGYHRYANAPEDVAFLRAWHRHHFIVKTSVNVNHNERDIEFFELQNMIKEFVLGNFNKPQEEYLDGIWIESCENLAEAIVDYLSLELNRSFIEVSVGEDGESEATVTQED